MNTIATKQQSEFHNKIKTGRNMQADKIFLGAVLAFILNNNAFAANKTHLTDMLGAGNSRTDLAISTSMGSYKTRILSPTSVLLDENIKFSSNSFLFDYSRGVSDRFDISISAPLFEKWKATVDTPPNNSTTFKNEGQGDIAFGAKYLLLDKQQNHVSWTMTASYSPSTAPSDTGKVGRGYAQSGINTAIAMPTGLGDVVLVAGYSSGGEKHSAGTTTKYGDVKSAGVYLESMIDERTTLTPYVSYSVFGSTTYGMAVTPSNKSYQLGLKFTHDVSSAFSLQANAVYQWMKDQAYIDFMGNEITTTAYHSYGLQVSTIFFF